MNIGCVVLAGGQSRRMGKDKAELIFDNKTFLAKITAELDDFDEKYIARGTMRRIDIPKWQNIDDLYPDCGPIGGIHGALTRCDAEALFCVACDMPLLRKSFVRELCKNLNQDIDAVVPLDIEGRLQPLCAVYRKTCQPVLERQIEKGEYRMKAALDQLRVRYIQIQEKVAARQLTNINTPQDYGELEYETDEFDQSDFHGIML